MRGHGKTGRHAAAILYNARISNTYSKTITAGQLIAPLPIKGFPLFSALRMASPDPIIVDHHAAIGGKTPVVLRPCVHPLLVHGAYLHLPIICITFLNPVNAPS